MDAGTSITRNDGTPSKQSVITSFVSMSAAMDPELVQLFNPNHPRQKAIGDAIVKHLIVGCSLPVSLVEDPHFRAFVEVCERR